ncbi:MAG: 3'-5' exonuclease [Bacillota bacterium]|nr:3'-5' exonuclease [Bacillota bacterium]
MNYIIFDLEATCWENENGRKSEIIEIGAVKLNYKLEKIALFSKFVKPVINPELSDFCTKLTTIKQSDVENADIFEKVIKEFEDFIGEDGYLCSWGFYDKKQILAECTLKDYSGKIVNLLEKHISVKHQFAKIREIRPCGMSYALELLGLKLEGTHHRGIDDALNITKIFKEVFEELRF